MTTSITLTSPAKLNLNLNIIGRRADGYHLLQSLFQMLDIGDTLCFNLTQTGEAKLSQSIPGVADADNLIIKAAELLKPFRANADMGILIDIEKHLPMGGGLGGGSSNAATTLLALNQLWQCDRTQDQLAALGATLGADVPFFVIGETAWVEGIGERITPVDYPSAWYVVLHPRINISTPAVFQHPRLTRNSPTTTVADILNQGGRNDCEPVVRALYPDVDQAINWLGQYGNAQLTGTGSCIFASFRNEQDAKQVLYLAQSNYDGFVAYGVAKSPNIEQLKAK